VMSLVFYVHTLEILLWMHVHVKSMQVSYSNTNRFERFRRKERESWRKVTYAFPLQNLHEVVLSKGAGKVVRVKLQRSLGTKLRMNTN
jgi:hypothetical protein